MRRFLNDIKSYLSGFTFAAAILWTGSASAFPGGLDTSFGCAAPPCVGYVLTGVPAPSGVATGNAMALQSDGKIVMAGSSGMGINQNFAVIRLNSNGTLDSTFNGGGTSTVAVTGDNDHANAVAIQADGKIVAAGYAFENFVGNFALARFNSNGTVDSGFGSKKIAVGSTYNEAYAVAIDGSGNIVMAGKAGDNPATDFALVRYTAGGSPDVSFNGSGKVRTVMPFTCSGGCIGQAQALAIQSDGKIIAGGWSGQLGNSDFIMVRYNSNGTIDSSFGTSGIVRHVVSTGNDLILSLKIITIAGGTQRILAAGTTNPTGNNANYAIARYTMSGAVDTAFGTNGVVTTNLSGGNDVAASVAVDANGMVVIGGDLNDLAGDFVVARYTANGATDTSFGCGVPGSCLGYAATNLAGTDQGKSVAIQADGRIVVGGTAAAGTSSAKFAVVRYDVGGTPPPPNGPTQLSVTSVNAGNPVSAGAGFSVVVQSRNLSGAPTNVIASTQVSLSLTAGTGPLSGTTSCTIPAAANTCTANGLTLTAAQTGAIITATRISGDTLSPGASSPFNVVAGAATNFLVSGFPSNSASGSSNPFTVRARDQYNNTATGYTGAVRFASTDGAATLPANYTFTGSDAGVHQFSATLRTVGTWSISAIDTANSAISGIQTGLIVTGGSVASITVVSGSGQNTNVNTNFAFGLTALVRDGNNNPVPNVSVVFAVPGSGASAKFTGGVTSRAVMTDANGNANSGTVTANMIGGSYSATATAGTLPPATFALTNNKVNSSTTLARTAGTSPAAVNSSLTFTATVSGSAGAPTGTVNFFVDGSTPLCSNVSLNGSGQAACTTQALTGGTRLLSAQYAGNTAYNASTSNSLSQSMSKATPTVVITGTSPNPSGVNAAVTISYSVTPSPSGPVNPSGNVTVGDGTVSCTGTVAAGQCSITFTSSGTKTLTASYAGDASFNAATSATRSHSVTGGGATVTLSRNPTSIVIGGSSTITATVSGSQGTPTGTVAVSGAGASCNITLSGGTGSCSLTPNNVGSNQTITGNYSGNGTYGASSGSTTLTVSKANATVLVTVNPGTVSVGQNTTVTATVSGGAGTPTGTVAVNGAGGSCIVNLSGGTGTCPLTGNSIGANQTITGGYSGDARYNIGNDTTTLTVNGSGSSSTLNVTKFGSGSGTVTSNTAGISCGNDCTETYAGTTSVTLTANPGGGSIFTGWLGGRCTGTGQCVVTVSGITNVSATFAPNSLNPPTLDIDGNDDYDALTDGLLALRYLFGLDGGSLVDGAIGSGASRTTSAQVIAYLDNIRPILDIDGNGTADALTDGILILRDMFGLNGDALIDGAIGANPTRWTATQIVNFLNTLTP